MSKIETAAQLVKACENVAKSYNTLYVLGCCGAPMTGVNKTRYLNAQSFNRQAARKTKIQAAGANVFGFDCVGLIKALLWGWFGDVSKNYGGASVYSNGVPDVNADQMIARCKDVSTDFSQIQPGEVVWMSGHIGVYIGDGLAVEATHRWKDGVQRTAVHNIGTIPGYNGRKWTKHGKLPWINYEDVPKLDTTSTGAVKVDPAATFTKSFTGTYRVNSVIGLKLRAGASTSKKILETMPNGSTVKCYGYHTGSWLFVVSASGKQGFCHKSLLKKK